MIFFINMVLTSVHCDVLGSIDPSKGITDVVDAVEVDDSDPTCVHSCFFIAPENNICVFIIDFVMSIGCGFESKG